MYEKRNSEHATTLAQLRLKVEQQGAQLDLAQQRNTLLQDENNGLHKKTQTLERKLEELKCESTARSQDLVLKEGLVLKLEKELQDRTAEVSLLNSRLEQSLHDARRQAEEETERLLSKERASQSKALDLQSELSRARTELSCSSGANKRRGHFGGYHEPPSLSPYAAPVVERLSSLQLLKSRFSSGSGESSPGFSEEVHNSFSSGSILSLNNRNSIVSTASSIKKDIEQLVSEPSTDTEPSPPEALLSPPPTSGLLLLSPKAMKTAGDIIRFQEEKREKAKMALQWRQEEQEKLMVAVVSSESEQLKRYEEMLELKQRQDLQSVRDMMERETKESIGRQEKLKEEQRHRTKILNLRLREAEEQRLREAELEKQRLAEGDFPSVEDMTVAERALHEMRALIHQQQEEVNRAEEKKKREAALEEQRKQEAELKAKQEAEKKAAESAKEKAKRTGLQMGPEESTLKWYKELQDSASAVAKSFEEFSSSKDAKMKKLKLNLLKAAVIPVSQISTKSGSHLREIYDKIDKLLSGKPVQSGGMSVSTSNHAQALQFVSYKLAEKFVKQGEEEVAAHFEAAFPIAAVASGIWEQHPVVGEMFLAHLHQKCPYAIPFNPQKDETATDTEHYRMMGYRIRWPYTSKQGPAPHGLNHGWRWLAQMLNMEPHKYTTATVLFDFLEVCGNALMKQYQGQFWKLLLFLREEYFPRIKAITEDGQMGALTRLQKFLETSLQNRTINPPKGQLTSVFWRS
ncbi:hypothetical protein WMY93_004663 [Mugilogobius chulae]|uniref:mRNA export factor GLE1 n=1 Tax=Mugilogobius chulae TaxID=88201 RepID=A0AAW0PP66_9GOBI